MTSWRPASPSAHIPSRISLWVYFGTGRERERGSSICDWLNCAWNRGHGPVSPFLIWTLSPFQPPPPPPPYSLFASRFGYRLLPLIAAIHAWGSNTGEVNRERRDCRQCRSGQCMLRLPALLNRNRSRLRNDVTEKIFWRDGFLRSIMKMAYNWIMETESSTGFKFWSFFYF